MKEAVSATLRRTCVVAALAAAGCTTPAKVQQSSTYPVGDRMSVVDLSADRRLGIAVDGPDGPTWVCSEPAPEAAESINAGLSLALKGENGSLTEEGTQVALNAGERQRVRLAEQLLFRACELGRNTSVGAADALALFRDVLDALARMYQGPGSGGAGDGGNGSTPPGAP